MTKDEMLSRPYRLGIDVGSNSLGWFVVWLNDKGEPTGLGPGGARIYPDGRDPQSKESNAADRRVARGARRRRDRYLKRRGNLMTLLIAHGLMPAEEPARKALESLDPYELRAKALDEPLPAHHIGRALFHLNQRRGFLSNRKTEKKKDSESGAIKIAASRLDQSMKEAAADTLGEFFHRRHTPREIAARQTAIRAELKRAGKDNLKGNARKKAWAKIRKRLFPEAQALPEPLPVRTRNRGTGPKAEYDFYPTRQLLLHEFDTIWNRQAQHHSSMTEEARRKIHHEIFFQRELKQPPVGKCSLDPAKDNNDVEGFRCPWSHPLAQRFRIWQEVRNLAIVETGSASRILTKEEGNNVATILIHDGKPALTKKGELSFDKIRNILGLPTEARFNLEGEKRDHLKGDQTAAKLSEKDFFGKAWRGFPLGRQIEIVTRLEEEQESAALVDWLVENTGIDKETADRVTSAFLPDGHSRLGLRAIKNLLRNMEGGSTKTEAEALEYPGSHSPTGELSADGLLPYYGEWLQDDVVGTGDPDDTIEKRWGRFPNPTVHIGLGQLRRVVNALIAEYGPPAEIAVEMTRAFKLSPKKLTEIEKVQADNQRKNEKRAEQIQGLRPPQAVNARNLLKLRLWEELNLYDPLDRRCPYSGEVISIERLMSEETDIDHLIPFADSWDDSAANKIVCMRYANRAKGKQTPFDAFGTSPTIDGHRYDWDAISLRAAPMQGKAWRFGPDAAHRFDAQGGFQARQLNETGWLARVALHYLAAVTDSREVHVLPGKLTAMIRGKWGPNGLLPDHNYSDAKNRKDHRHHAIDAMVGALTDRKLLHRMSSAYDDDRQRIEIPLPWPSLRDDLDAKLKAMTVSHKPDHGLQAQLHEDTAYGTVAEPEKEGGANLVYRKGFRDLNDKEILRIRDIRLREMVQAHVSKEKDAGKDLKTALQSFGKRTDIPGLPRGIRHVRLTKAENPKYLVAICDKSGHSYKAYSAGENAFVDIIATPDGKWTAEAMSVFRANQNDPKPRWRVERPDARFVMRVFKGDMLRIEHEGTTKIVRIVRLSPSNNVLYLVKHNEAGNFQARHDDKNDPFRWIFANFDKLREWNAERVRVDDLGRLWRVKPEEAARTL